MFEIFPKIVRAGGRSTISVRARYRELRGQYRVTVTAAEGIGAGAPRTVTTAATDGRSLSFPIEFPAEQEYLLAVEEVGAAPPAFLAEVRVFALHDDLFSLRPFKGDMHMHSTRSDGQEEPGYVAAACRRIGMDFMALTDHRLYAPSLEAIRAFDGCPVDLLMLPGEEVHPPDCGAHILNIGGSASVNDLLGTPAYGDGVRRIAASLEGIPPEHRVAYAACAWCFQRVRELGGIAIFPHPYWLTHNAYNVAEPVLAALFARAPFDALEVLGGYSSIHRESNSLQVARYHEERARGRRIAAVGSSDAHGCERGELFGWYFTVVFAPRLDLASLAGAVRGLLSVAVEWLPGEEPRVYGPFRLVRLAHFLLREHYPLHDELAREEGMLMLAHLAGDAGARETLGRYKGRADGLAARLWPITP